MFAICAKDFEKLCLRRENSAGACYLEIVSAVRPALRERFIFAFRVLIQDWIFTLRDCIPDPVKERKR